MLTPVALDEVPELGTRNLETLRQPLEDKVITISRASGSLTFPANFISSYIKASPVGEHSFVVVASSKH